MKTEEKQIPATTKMVYVADDGKEFDTEVDCKKHEKSVKLKGYFDKLNSVDFWSRFKITPYLHNVLITHLGKKKPYTHVWDEDYQGFCLMYGRMGNGDDIVTLKLKSNSVGIIRYSTHDWNGDSKKYLGCIPTSVLDSDNFEDSINEYLKNRDEQLLKREIDKVNLRQGALSKLSDAEKKELGLPTK